MQNTNTKPISLLKNTEDKIKFKETLTNKTSKQIKMRKKLPALKQIPTSPTINSVLIKHKK